ncbi:MAG TPA: aspartate aminotransferase family protein [Polyangiaceae bacterium]|nr:aspartate aminotransferase family protein [Polyangiaceae bacterium]
METTTESQKLVARRRAVVAQGVGQFAGDLTAASAQGAKLVDADGREFIDFAGGIGVVNIGHCPAEIVQAVQAQAAKLMHASIHVASYEPYVALCEKLVELAPHGERTKAMLVNSGAEAVENAIKIARQATGRSAVITFTDAFHGRTLLATTLTSKTRYKLGCGPFAPEVYRLQFPNHFRHGHGTNVDAFVERALGRLRQAFVTMVSADDVAAVIIECVQGEGGFVPVPEAYLRGLREICTEHGILLICDEVQSGFFRAGAWAAYQRLGVTPDLSTWAKSLGNGLPISAVIGRAEVMDAAKPGTLGGTYGGNPVACAGALATIEYMQKNDMAGHAERVGSKVRARFEMLRESCGVVADVRGLGAMIAMEFCHERDPNKPAGEVVARVTALCRERGLIVLPASAYGNVIRVLSPLTISDSDLEQGLDILEAAVLETVKEMK